MKSKSVFVDCKKCGFANRIPESFVEFKCTKCESWEKKESENIKIEIVVKNNVDSFEINRMVRRIKNNNMGLVESVEINSEDN